MDEGDGLVCAYLLDGEGGGRALDWPEIHDWSPEQGVMWVHLDRRGERAVAWLRADSGIDPIIFETLLVADIRPRLLGVGDALLVNLRGVNLNPGAEPEDMVGLRLWLEKDRVISLRHRRVMAVSDIREQLAERRGPADAAALLVEVTARLIDRMGSVIAEIEDAIDAIEDEVLANQRATLRGRLSELRRTAISLRRYLAPQREVMERLPNEPRSWLDDLAKARLREVANRLTRIIEDLDAARERAQVTQDELSGRLADQMNRNTYRLTLIAALFLPPSLVTGMLGMNVGGVPWTGSGWGLAIVIALLAAMTALELWLLRWLKWL